MVTGPANYAICFGRSEFLFRMIFMEAKMKTFRKIAIAVSLIFTIPACSHFSQDENIASPVILADCFVDFHLSAWQDLDGNGFWDTSEPSLEGVVFRIDGRFASPCYRSTQAPVMRMAIA